MAIMEKEELQPYTLCVLDETGDSRMQWDKKDPAQIAKAQARFNEFKNKGYIAYKVAKGGGMGEVISAFDPNEERIIMHRALVGG
jgi:hypothetical protein